MNEVTQRIYEETMRSTLSKEGLRRAIERAYAQGCINGYEQGHEDGEGVGHFRGYMSAREVFYGRGEQPDEGSWDDLLGDERYEVGC